MIKTFENCSPEYQITIVCFFIFLTLLCMILVIYEGTGKRQRKMLLPDSVLLIVIFLITAVLCVWQRAFYEEDSMILFKIPYVILIVIGIGVLGANSRIFKEKMQYKINEIYYSKFEAKEYTDQFIETDYKNYKILH